MERLIGRIGDVKDPRTDSGDSGVDQLNSRHTVALLFIFSIIVTLKQHYVGEPIHCFQPEHFTDSHVKYVDALCWVNNTYVISFNEEIPKVDEEHRYIGYYQWTSLILSAQAILFYLPRSLWMLFNKKSGIEVTTITGASVECQMKPDTEEREKILRYMVMHMSRFLGEVRGKLHLGSKFQSAFWRAYGSYLSFLYILTKFTYCLNSIFQLVLLDVMLGLRHQLHGVNFLFHLFKDDDDVQSPLFPRVAFCDFEVRYPGNVMRYTVQCSLPINLFNEKIFLAVWFWLVAMSIINIISLLLWIWYAVYFKQHYNNIKTKLMTMEVEEKPDMNKVKLFVNEYLRRDGIFLTHLVSGNSSDLIASELICGLWKYYWDPKVQEKYRPRRESYREPNLDRNVHDIAAHWRRKSSSHHDSTSRRPSTLDVVDD